MGDAGLVGKGLCLWGWGGTTRTQGDLKFSDVVAAKSSFHVATLSSNLEPTGSPETTSQPLCSGYTHTLAHVYLVFLLRMQVPGVQSQCLTVLLPCVPSLPCTVSGRVTYVAVESPDLVYDPALPLTS